MKKSYFSLLCIIAFNSIISFNIKAQDFAPFRYDTESEVYDNLWKAGGELFVDDFAVVEDIKAPSGYKPFYISLFGRHGARFVHETELYSRLATLFRNAEIAGKLTPEGKSLALRYKDFYGKVAHREGALTFKGQLQWRNIAKRMYASYPEVFRKNTFAKVYSTDFERVLMSMFSFVDELRVLDRSFDFNMDAGLVYLDFLNPNASKSPSFVKGRPLSDKALVSRADFFASKIDAASFVNRFFNDLSFVESQYGSWRFEEDLALAILDIQCLDGVDNVFEDIFNKKEFMAFWEVRNYNGYLMMGASPLSDKKRVMASSAALKEIITNAEKDISGNNVDLRLRFSHDSGLLPLLVFMRLNNFGAVIDKPEDVKNYWRSFDIPMASNLQLVFYRSRKNKKLLVKPIYNGKPAVLPFKAISWPYYSWSDFKDYYIPLIEDAEVFLKNYSS